MSLEGRISLTMSRLNLFFLQEGTNSVGVLVKGWDDALVLGRKVRVKGSTGTNHLARVENAEVEVLPDPLEVPEVGRGWLPALGKWPRFQQVMEISGAMVREVRMAKRRTVLKLRQQNGGLSLGIDAPNSEWSAEQLLHATVSVRCVLLPGSGTNEPPALVTEGWRHLKVVDPPMRFPFRLPETRVKKVLKTDPAKLRTFPVRVRGAIAGIEEGSFLLNDRSGTIRFLPNKKLPRLVRGDVVDVRGFTEAGRTARPFNWKTAT